MRPIGRLPLPASSPRTARTARHGRQSLSDRAVRFMREQTFNRNLVVSGNVLRDGRFWYRMQDGTEFRLTQRDLETLDRYQFKPRFAEN